MLYYNMIDNQQELRLFNFITDEKSDRKGDDIMEKTQIHPETGEILRRDIRPIEFSCKSEKIFVGNTFGQPQIFERRSFL